MGEAIASRWSIDRVVRTSSQRATQTVASAGLSDLPTEVDDRWQEIDFGDYDERPITDVAKNLIAAWASDVTYVPPNGESMAAMHRRIGDALADLVDRATAERILVVTHATPIKSAVTWLLDGEVETILKLRVSLASITAFMPAPSGLIMSDFNWCPAENLREPRP